MDIETMTIEISVRVTRSVNSYTTVDVAAAKIEDTVLWSDIEPDIRRVIGGLGLLDAATRDVRDRVMRQLKIEHDRRHAIRVDAERQPEPVGL